MTINKTLRALLVMMLCLGSFLIVVPAHAAEPVVKVELTEVTPTVLRITGDLEITGVVTNDGTEPLSDLTVRLWRYRAPITNLDALDIALESDPDDFYGTFLLREPRANVSFDTPLEPGESREFSVSASNEGTVDPLLLNSTGVGYLVGVKVTQGGANEQLGSARTLIGSLVPMEQASAVVVAYLTAQPSLLADGSGFIDNSLPDELTNRLEKLLQLAEQPGVTTLLDPALFDEVVALANGVPLAGEPAQSEDQLLAQQWLRRLRTVIASGSVYRTWYGSPDLVTAYFSDRSGVLDATQSIDLGASELAALPLAGWVNEEIDEQLATFLAQGDAEVIFTDGLISHAMLQVFNSQVFVSTPSDQFAGGPAPEPSTTTPQLAGRIAAQQLISNAQGDKSVIVADEEPEVEALLGPATWRQIVSLPSSMETETTPADFGGEPLKRSRATETLTALDDLQHAYEFWGDLTTQPVNSAPIVARSWSQRWVDDAQAIVWVQRSIAPQLAALSSGEVAIHTSTSWVLTSETNDLPLMITNTKTIPVTVRVAFESENPGRIDVEDTELVTIPGGESAALRVRPKADSNGTVAITALLETTGGRQVGEPVQIQVSANSAGIAGWVIILASGVVLLGATVLRVRRVRQARAGGNDDE